MEIKKEAALVAYNYLQDMYLKTMKDVRGKMAMFKAYSKFCNCLRTFHSLTVQYKCNGFAENFKGCISSSCPLGRGGTKWRKHHKLEWVDSRGLIFSKRIVLSQVPPCYHNFRVVMIICIEQSVNTLVIALKTYQKLLIMNLNVLVITMLV